MGGAPLDDYHYDGQCAVAAGKIFGECEERWYRNATSKMELAKESVKAVLGQLNPEDGFGIVLFDTSTVVFQPFGKVNDTDILDVHSRVQHIQTRGGTDLSAGMDEATAMLKGIPRVVGQERETRILIITDAQPNDGDLSSEGLHSRAVSNADIGIHTTFFGVGLDFNSDLVEMFSAVRGANYLTVSSAAEFQKRMVDEFDLLVTPLVFNLTLQVLGNDSMVDSVFGLSGGSEDLDLDLVGLEGQVFSVTTLFPSRKDEGAVKGGVILVKLKGQPAKADVVASYRTEMGSATRAGCTWNRIGASNLTVWVFEKQFFYNAM